MGVLTYVLGRSGTGKSYSMRNFPKDKLAVVNVQGKPLPFRGSAEIKTINSDSSKTIESEIKKLAEDYKSIVVDDFQYLMANEFMRRAYESGWDKFTEIGRHAWDIANIVTELPADVIVYVMCHTDVDAEGTERLKTIGKLLDEKIFLEGMSTIVLKTFVADGKYTFTTQNNGKDTVKSPADMFPAFAIDNDLYYVDQKIREYYGLGNTLTVDELADADAEVAHDEIAKPERKKRGRRSSEEKEEPKETPVEETKAEAEKPKRGRKRSEDPEVKAAQERNDEAIANSNLPDDGREELPFEEAEMPEVEPMPRRRSRNTKEAEPTAEPTTEEQPEETAEETPAPTRRRRRRG